MARTLSPMALSVLLTVSASASQASTTIQLWHSYLDKEQIALTTCIQRFNTAQSNIQIKPVYLPFDEISQQLSGNKNSTIKPDLFIFAHDRLGSWLNQKLLAALPDAESKRAQQDFIPTTLEALTDHQQLYGLPLNFKSLALIYNPKLLKTAPTSSANFSQLAKQLPEATQLLNYEYDNLYYHAAILNAFGAELLPQEQADITQPGVAESIQLVKSWRQQGWLAEDTSNGLVLDMFNSQKVAMILAGPWNLPNLKIPFEVAPMPTLTETGHPMTPWLTVEGIFMSAQSSAKTEATQVMQALTNEACARDLTQIGHQLPARKALYQEKQIAEDKVLMAYYQQSKTAIPMPKSVSMSLLWRPMAQLLTQVIIKDQPFKPIRDQIQTELAKP